MMLADLSAIALQLALPAAALLWLAIAPGSNLLVYVVQTVSVLLMLAAVALVPIWLVLPWWTIWIYIGAAAIAWTSHLLRGQIPTQTRVPDRPAGWLGIVVLAIVCGGLTSIVRDALIGRMAPDEVVDLAFPMSAGTYFVANGGSTATVNAHFLTLDPKTERQRAYRGQSYAVDLVKLGKLGLRARGWRPPLPTAYETFGEAVFAPCDGTVIAARNDRPDMLVPQMDNQYIEGNFVAIQCGDVAVVLAHFKQDSLEVGIGNSVSLGDRIGMAGNSGKTNEPHLHIHAQTLGTDGELVGGEPLFLRLGGLFPVRNDRLHFE